MAQAEKKRSDENINKDDIYVWIAFGVILSCIPTLYCSITHAWILHDYDIMDFIEDYLLLSFAINVNAIGELHIASIKNTGPIFFTMKIVEVLSCAFLFGLYANFYSTTTYLSYMIDVSSMVIILIITIAFGIIVGTISSVCKENR